MASVDMDVDAPRTMGFDAHGDDDLIDYDEDDIQIPGTTWKLSDTTGTNDESFNLEETTMETAGNQTTASHGASGEEPQQAGRDKFSSEQLEEPENISSLPNSHNNDDAQKHEIDFEILPEHDHVESTHAEHEGGEDAGDVASRTNTTEEAVNEIDYEEEEEEEEAFHGNTGDEQASKTLQDGSRGLSVVDAGDDVSQQPEDRKADDVAPSQDQSVEEAKEHEDQEITYEEDGEDATQTVYGKDSAVGEESIRTLPTEDASQNLDDMVTVGAHTTEDKDELDEAGYDEGADQHQTHAEEESIHQNKDDIDARDHSASGSSSEHDANFPAITVQYKGEEFPFFSFSSDGFFSELSILDGTVGSMLASLRAVLGDEVSEEEEIVFQIDELGLEYSETHPHDSVNNVTLRHILDVFEILVRNQDPGSSRTLYTYLFTKTNTTKRLDFLSQSAADGRGLEEVIRLFESPMPHATSTHDATDDPDDYATEEMYEGVDEEAHEQTLVQTGETGVEDELDELFKEEVDDDTTLGNHTEQYEQYSETQMPQDGEAATLMRADELDQASEELVPKAESANATDGPAKDQTDVVFDDDNIDFNLGATPNVVQDELETAEESKEPFAEAFAPLSRASSTIDNGTQAPDDDLELHFDDEATAPIAGDGDGDDLLDEIDWRDPDPATQGEEDETPPSATKRSRPEDGTDAGEHEAKRLRS
jgi:hypothetical protein